MDVDLWVIRYFPDPVYIMGGLALHPTVLFVRRQIQPWDGNLKLILPKSRS